MHVKKDAHLAPNQRGRNGEHIKIQKQKYGGYTSSWKLESMSDTVPSGKEIGTLQKITVNKVPIGIDFLP